ncbi:hypothetical protein [Bacteroides faecis]|uniref:hypothetical protein n=1 Tax=Bacteroides faecis TaxID=674529 RepID=UPI002166527F|nr:hypothetical protein [Bacteroides faecis]MCS2916941.1 hypothetical protein [Bacteroides faecis]
MQRGLSSTTGFVDNVTYESKSEDKPMVRYWKKAATTPSGMPADEYRIWYKVRRR